MDDEAGARFLFMNGYAVRTTQQKVIGFLLDVEVKKLSFDEIEAWLKKHSGARSNSRQTKLRQRYPPGIPSPATERYELTSRCIDDNIMMCGQH